MAVITLALGDGGVLSASAQPVLVNPLGQQTSFVEPGNLDASVLFDLAFETNGTAWIAASDGLHRYDGYEWSLFDTRQGLPSRYVRTVMVTPQGVLWVGTDQRAGTFDGQRFTLAAPPDRLAGPSVRRIRLTADGALWFCSDKWPDRSTGGGLAALRNGQWRVYGLKDGLPSEHVYNYFEDSKGRGFALTDKGVAQKTGNADLALSDPASPASIREHLTDILSTSQRAADLCLQMLAYSGRGRFVIRRINLTDLVRETAQMLEVSISKNVRLSMRLAPNLPAVEADATQLRQIVMNLVINASEAIGERNGTISLTTGVRHCDRAWLDACGSHDRLDEGDYVILEVRDSGCGMDRATMRKIFDPFFSTKFTGRGLGLAAVLGIVRGHRGAIQLESQVGTGTTFAILLPTAQNGSSTPAPVASSRPNRGATGPKGTLLLVDDEADLRTVAKKMLERLGYEVLVARNGLEAIEIVKNATRKIDCVLLDWNMPRLNGVETFCELRRLRPGLPAVLASGYGEQELAQRFGADGLAGFVQKPYTMDTLAQVLDHALSGAKMDAEAESITTGSTSNLPK